MTLPEDIGLSTDAWERLPLAAALDRIARYSSLAEIHASDAHSLLSAANRRAAAAAGLRLTVHGPFAGLEPGSTRERRRRRTVAAHKRHLEAAAEVGAVRYVVHPDFQHRPCVRDPRVVAALERTFAELATAQQETGVPVVVENMPDAKRSHFAAPGDLDLGGLGFALDTGHAAICGTLDEFLHDPMARLMHVHLHDNLGPADGRDRHAPLGHGVVDVAAVLRTARAVGATVIIEVLDEDAVRQSISHLEAKGLVPLQ